MASCVASISASDVAWAACTGRTEFATAEGLQESRPVSLVERLRSTAALDDLTVLRRCARLDAVAAQPISEGWLTELAALLSTRARPERKALAMEETMESRHAALLSSLVGVVVGAAAVQALHAEAKPPVYMVAINELTNPDAYRTEYLPKAQAAIKQYGGSYVAAGPGTIIDGSFPKGRVVILRWDSLDELKKWHESPEYQAALNIGKNYAHYNVVAVDGVAK